MNLERQHEHASETPSRTVEALAPVSVTERASEQTEAERVQALLVEFKAIAARRKRLSSALWWITAGTMLPFLAITLYLIPRAPFGHWSVTLMMGLQAFVPMTYPLLLIPLSLPSRRQRAITEELAHCQDVRSIVPLLNCLGVGDKRARRMVLKALLKLLPRVCEADDACLSEADLRLVCAFFRRPWQPLYRRMVGVAWDDLVVATLHAVGEIGDAGAIKPVLDLATQTPRTEAEERVVKAADQCLSRLRRRVDEQAARQNLLVPSSAPEAEADRLVRPPRHDGENDPKVLLRPGMPEDQLQ